MMSEDKRLGKRKEETKQKEYARICMEEETRKEINDTPTMARRLGVVKKDVV